MNKEAVFGVERIDYVLALVSRKATPSVSANVCASIVVTFVVNKRRKRDGARVQVMFRQRKRVN